jgi:hypothetical protein
VTRNGGKVVTLRLAPRTARAVDLALSDRMDGAIFLGPDGLRLDRHAAGVPLGDVQEAASHADPRTPMRYDRGRVSLDRHATYIVASLWAGRRQSGPITQNSLPAGS